MRIALVAASLDILGGHGVQATALTEGLRQDGHKVLFVPINPRFPPGLRWLRRVPVLRTIINLTLYLPALARLRQADVVHVFCASYWSFLLGPVPAILVARALGCRVVLHYHSGEAEDHLARWGRRVHPWLRKADAIVVPSTYLRDIFRRHGYDVDVIPNIVDTTLFSYRARNTQAGPRILSTRNLESYYRVDTTIRALALIADQFPQASLTIVGSGSLASQLQSLAASLGVTVHFLGRVEPPAMPVVYDAADIFVNASVVDNQPVSILEAFAAGLPVVSTPTGDIGSLVREGETGMVVPTDDPAAIAKSVAYLLEHPDHALAMAQTARAKLDRHTWPRVRDSWAQVYAGVR